MLPVDNSIEWPESEIWGWAKILSYCSFSFTYKSQSNS